MKKNGKDLNQSSISILNNINLTELNDLKKKIISSKKVVYQEAELSELISEIDGLNLKIN